MVFLLICICICLCATDASTKGVLSLDEYSFDRVVNSTTASAILVKFDAKFVDNEMVGVADFLEHLYWPVTSLASPYGRFVRQFSRLAQEVATDGVSLLMAEVEVVVQLSLFYCDRYGGAMLVRWRILSGQIRTVERARQRISGTSNSRTGTRSPRRNTPVFDSSEVTVDGRASRETAAMRYNIRSHV